MFKQTRLERGEFIERDVFKEFDLLKNIEF